MRKSAFKADIRLWITLSLAVWFVDYVVPTGADRGEPQSPSAIQRLIQAPATEQSASRPTGKEQTLSLLQTGTRFISGPQHRIQP